MAEFSVLCPVYNVEKYLEQCIESVINQTFKDFELILVDDGSKDSSGSICDKYASDYSFIKVFHKPNEGLMATRRFALAKATGKWVINLDSDDWIVPDTLEKLSNYIKDYSPDCVVYSLERVFPDHVELFGKKLSDNPVFFEDKDEFFRVVFMSEDYNSLCRKAVLREKIGTRDFSEFYHIAMGEDRLQSYEIYENCSKYLIVPDVFYEYRFNGSSITGSESPKKFRCDFSVYEQNVAFLKQNSSFTEQDYNNLRKDIIGNISYAYIFKIARFRLPFSEKRKLFDEIKSNNFYKSFLNNGDFEGVSEVRFYKVLRLFKNNHYRILSFLGWMSRVRRRISQYRSSEAN